jgi:DNA replication initiation complex subunit (GINS family)
MKLTDEERKFIIDVLRLLEGLRRKLKDLLDK